MIELLFGYTKKIEMLFLHLFCMVYIFGTKICNYEI